jgi:hypothetical protein
MLLSKADDIFGDDGAGGRPSNRLVMTALQLGSEPKAQGDEICGFGD